MKYLLLILLLLGSFPLKAFEFGIDRLGEHAHLFSGKRLAILTHAAGVDKNQIHLIDHLYPKYQVVKLFAPEHGLRSEADDWVGDGVDAATGLPVISLYKRGTRAPAPEELKGIDAIVVDLQDVGVRYYTYFSTIAHVMIAAQAQNIEVILLDRPNLLGRTLEGEVLTADLAGGFTSYHTVPTRHGMTLGELALMLNAEKNIGCKLTVIKASEWQGESLWDKWDRKWTPPSPALVDPLQIPLYALWGTLENFNLAVGRGTTNELAFHVIGAPWITPEEAQKMSQKLNAMTFPGLSFSAFSWTVTRAAHTGKVAHGVKISGDFSQARTDEVTYEVARYLVKKFEGRISSGNMSTRSYGSQRLVDAIRAQIPFSQEKKRIDEALKAFDLRRRPYLLY